MENNEKDEHKAFGSSEKGVQTHEQVSDPYTYLEWVYPECAEDLSVGLLVQIVEFNKKPLKWRWFVLTDEVIKNAQLHPDRLRWIRISKLVAKDKFTSK
jgi:hypothetical protein